MFSTEEKSIVTLDSFANDKRYLPGGEYFERGFFDWEKYVIQHYSLVKPQGRILLLGSGAGREAAGILKLYPSLSLQIDAVEPCENLHLAAQEYFKSLSSVHLHHDTSQLFLNRVSTLPPYDLIWFGWGVWSHFIEEQDKHFLLSQLQKHSPRASVFLSYLIPTPIYRPGIHYFRHAGFLNIVPEIQVSSLAQQYGYRLEHQKNYPYPHALLKPKVSN